MTDAPTGPAADSLQAVDLQAVDLQAVDLQAVEQWFVRQGIPHFIADYQASTRVWTRAKYVLPVAYLAGALNAINGNYTFIENVGVFVAGVLLVVAVVAVARHTRDRWTLGVPELLAFLIGPSLPALAFGFQWRSAVASFVLGAMVLAVVYVVTSYGLLPMMRWALARLIEQVGALGQLFVRALPLMLLFVTFLFISTEVWQVAGLLFGLAYALTLFVFLVVGAIFVVSRLPQDVRLVGHFDSWDEVRLLAKGTPAEALVVPGGAVPSADPASWREWLNVGLLMLFTRAVQITLVATIMGAFFVVFGVLTISESTIETWTGQAPHVLATFTLTGRPLVLTEQLLRVAGFLAAFTGMYFTVVLVTDAVFREEFRADVVAEVRQAFAARALYLAARSA